MSKFRGCVPINFLLQSILRHLTKGNIVKEIILQISFNHFLVNKDQKVNRKQSCSFIKKIRDIVKIICSKMYNLVLVTKFVGVISGRSREWTKI